jgi:hypothetical protein
MNDERGMLGKLPRTRPHVESPRRVAARERAARAEGVPEPSVAADPEPKSAISGFEQLARAGFGLAGGAAAVGVRLAGRAAGEIGKAVGRR